MKFVLMGYGHIGKVHEVALGQIDAAQLVAVIDLDEGSSDIPHFKSLQDFCQSGIVADAVIVATPNGLHFTHAKEVLEAGYHVIIEKPVTLSTQDLERLLFIAENTEKRVFNMLQLRLSPVAQWVKGLLSENVLGEIYLVNIQCYWNRNDDYYNKRIWHGSKSMDGGVLFTQFSHFIDIMHFWFDELKPKDVRNFNFNHKDSTEFADSGIINFQIPAGGFGSMIYTTSTFQKNFDSTITLIAERGTLQIGGQYMNSVKYLNALNVENPYVEEVGKQFHAEALFEIMNAVSTKRSSLLDAVNAKNVIKFLEVVS